MNRRNREYKELLPPNQCGKLSQVSDVATIDDGMDVAVTAKMNQVGIDCLPGRLV